MLATLDAPRPVPHVVPPRRGTMFAALDALLRAGAIDARQRWGAMRYGALRSRFEAASRSTGRDGAPALGDVAWRTLRDRHAALLDAAGWERFPLDRLCLDDDPPLGCEVDRVRAALDRVAGFFRVA